MVDCFPRWIVWAMGIAVALAGAEILVLALFIMRNSTRTLRYARRVDAWPIVRQWTCGVPGCGRHKRWFAAWLHAAWKRPWLLRGR